MKETEPQKDQGGPATRAALPQESRGIALPKPPAALAGLFEHRPSGEQTSAYEEFLALIIEEHQPQGLREWFQVNEVVNAEWARRRNSKIGRSILRIAEAKALYTRLADAFADDELKKLADTGSPEPTQADASVEEKVPQRLAREWRKKALAAVSGDPAAIDWVEQRLGRTDAAPEIAMAPDFAGTLNLLGLAQRLTASETQRREGGLNELERLAEKRGAQIALAVVETTAGRVPKLADYARMRFAEERAKRKP